VSRDVDSAFTSHYIPNHDNDVLVLLDPTVTDTAQSEAIARECINRVQKLRKKAGLKATDDIRMEFKLLDGDSAGIERAILDHEDIIFEKVRGKLEPMTNEVVGQEVIVEEEQNVSNVRFLLRLLQL
jgi:isoleucyl-tRNA synthetase